MDRSDLHWMLDRIDKEDLKTARDVLTYLHERHFPANALDYPPMPIPDPMEGWIEMPSEKCSERALTWLYAMGILANILLTLIVLKLYSF